MEKFVEQSLLFDFYGELLTEHQRQIYAQVAFEDYSVSEVARDSGVSRQGIHDLIKRCNKILSEYESKLHLVEKFLHIRENVREIQKIADAEGQAKPEMIKIKKIADNILEEL